MKRWTKEEDNFLVKCIKDNPFNIRKAAIMAAERLNRSVRACEQHWYIISRKPEIGITFLSVADKQYLKNRKNIGSNSTAKATKSNLWDKIMKLLKLK